MTLERYAQMTPKDLYAIAVLHSWHWFIFGVIGLIIAGLLIALAIKSCK